MKDFRWWRSVLYRIGLAIGAALFLWQAWSAGEAILSQQIRVTHPESLVAAVGAVLIATVFQVEAWRLAMHDLGVGLSWRDAVRAYMLPFVARYIPGMVWGYLSRTHWLQTRHGTSPHHANLGAVVEIMGLLLSASVVATLGGLLAQRSFVWLIGLLSTLAVVSGVLLGPAVISVVEKRWGKRLPWDMRGWVAAVTLRRIGRAGLWQVGLWIFDGLMVWACLSGLNANSQLGGGELVTLVVAAFALSWSAGFLAFFLPAGLGLREVGLTYLLTTQAGMSPEGAAATAVLARAAILSSELVYVVFGLLLTPRQRQHNIEGSRSSEEPPSDQTKTRVG